MRRFSILGYLAVLVGCLVVPARGEQQVKLESGATLVGNVSSEGEKLVVDVDGAKIAVPFENVASVTSADTTDADKAKLALLKGLEAHVWADGEKIDTAQFAEAFRLDPNDPQIAFWYAYSLAHSGYGKAANDVFSSHREAITTAYPGRAGELSRRIEQRLKLEMLPPALLERLDEIAKTGKHIDPMAESTTCRAYYRLTDQHDQPIERSAFHIQCHGETENVESFGDGYYLFSYSRNRHFGHTTCSLIVSKPGLEDLNVSFNGSAREAENLGELRVQRLEGDDRRPVAVRVADPEGKPLSGATVTFTPMSRSSDSASIPPVTTNANGEAELQLYPFRYHCSVTLKDYNPSSQAAHIVAGDGNAEPIDVALHRAIRATMRVAWKAHVVNHPGMPPFGNGNGNESVSTGEFELQAGTEGGGNQQAGAFGPPWVRLLQSEDAMQLQFIEHFMGFRHAASDTTWVGRLKSTTNDAEETSGESLDVKVATELFDVLGLEELDAIADEFQVERTKLGQMPNQRGPVSLPVEAGDIYIGKINGRDSRSGQPAVIEFKILATELVRP